MFENEIYEYKILKVFLQEEKFARSFIAHLKPAYFRNPVLQHMCKLIKEYWEKYDCSPTMDYLKNERPEQIPKDLYEENLQKLENVSLEDLEYTENLFVDFCKQQMLKNAILKSQKYIQEKNFKKVEELVREAVSIGDALIDLGLNYFTDFSRLERKKEGREYVPTLIKALDECLGGGLSSKSLGVILGGTGVGKSMTLINFCKAAVLQQINCVYYTMELSAEKIALRFDCSFLGKTKAEILNYFRKTEEGIRKLYEQKVAGANLIIKEYPSGEATVDDIRSHLIALARRGIIVGEIFIDYAEIMRSRTPVDEFRFRIKDIYEGLRALAVEFSIPVWTAHQVTREALERVNLSLRDVSEAHWASNIADVIVAICQTPEERAKGTFRFRILKNRDNVVPQKDIEITVDYSKMLLKEKSYED